MIALVAALVAFTPIQEEAKLKQGWAKLVEAWKAVEAYKAADADGLSDAYLKVVSQIHAAFEAVGFLDAQNEFGPSALKQLFKMRAARIRGASPQGDEEVMILRAWGQGMEEEDNGGTLDKLLAALRKLGELKDKGADDEDNVQDEMATVRKSLKAVNLTSDETPVWMRRRLINLTRALVTGGAYPELVAATEEQTKQFKALILDLGNEAQETRDKASKELGKVGELAHALLVDALKSEDLEVVGRVKKILGLGHQPWKNAKPAAEGHPGVRVFRAVIQAPPPVPVPAEKEKEEEKKDK